jgi:Ca2+-binding RTX toxin-like protein
MNFINGDDSPNFLDGTLDDDVFQGNGGRDTLVGGSGNDILNAGTDNDSLLGGEGNDTLNGDFGNDTERGGAGNDVFMDALGNDRLFGDEGDDLFHIPVFSGGSTLAAPTAVVTGGLGQDTYLTWRAPTGANFPFPGMSPRFNYTIADFDVGAGGDVIDVDELLRTSGVFGYQGGNPFGGAEKFLRLTVLDGDTKLQWDTDGLEEEYGWRTVLTLKGVDASDTPLTMHNFAGGISPSGAAVPGAELDGTVEADSLEGGFFNDTISGFESNDTLDGSGGNDIIEGGAGDDRIAGGPGNDTMDGGEGDDTFVVEFAGKASVVTGGAGRDVYLLKDSELSRGYAVTDFAVGGGGDVIDVFELMQRSAHNNHGGRYIGGNPFDPALGFLRLVQDGADTHLRWDVDGVGTEFRARTMLTLKDVDLDTLTSDNFAGGLPPDGSPGTGVALGGGSADESLPGGFFNDTITGGDGNDTLRGFAGNDSLEGGAGNDMILGGIGNDTLYGGDGDDQFRMDIGERQGGDDWYYGGDGGDSFADFEGNNVIDAGAGNDFFTVGDAVPETVSRDTVTGGLGNDLYSLTEVERSQDYRVMDFAVGPGGDILDVGRVMAVSTEEGGYSGGNPFALGYLRLLQSGGDTLVQWDQDGAAGTRRLVTLIRLVGVDRDDITSDNFLGQEVVGDAADNELLGGIGNDTVRGLDGNDTLDGSLGGDLLEGGSGNDLYLVDDADDETIEESNNLPGGLAIGGGGPSLAGSGFIDTVRAAVDYALSNFVENLTLTGSAKHGTGNELANVIKGNAKANTLTGGDGNDRLDGSSGNDILDGGGGNDRLVGGIGNDVLVWGTGDRFDGGAGTDTLKITTGNVDLPGDLMRNMEIVDLRGGESSRLTLTTADVLAMSPTDSVKILGDEGDTVSAAGFTASGGPVNGFQTYRSGTATLLVDTDINVS